MTPPPEPLDQIMHVMEQAFDPHYGEAWNRRQVGDALTLSNCRYWLMDREQRSLTSPESYQTEASPEAAGFLMSRQICDEEEILLIAVTPKSRRLGIASALLEQLTTDAKKRGVTRLFLEMREGNPAETLYLSQGFQPIGRRPNYYTRGAAMGLDAITFARDLH